MLFHQDIKGNKKQHGAQWRGFILTGPWNIKTIKNRHKYSHIAAKLAAYD